MEKIMDVIEMKLNNNNINIYIYIYSDKLKFDKWNMNSTIINFERTFWFKLSSNTQYYILNKQMKTIKILNDFYS